MKPIVRRPHGPINQRFSPMFWSVALNRVVFTKPSRPIRAAYFNEQPKKEAA